MIAISEAHEALFWTLNQNWERYVLCLAECCHAPKTKSVHELRTTLRRLVAILDLAQELKTSSATCKLRKQLKSELSSLRDLRDLQNQENTLDGQLKLCELQEFRDTLRKKRKQEQRIIKNSLNATRLKRQRIIVQRTGECLLTLSRSPALSSRAKIVFERSLLREFRELERDANRAKGAVPSSIHQTRIKFKKFRYSWDALSALFPIHKKTETKIKEFQKLLGEIQDTVVLIQLLYKFLIIHKKTSPEPKFQRFIHSVEGRQENLLSLFFPSETSFSMKFSLV